MVRTKRRTTSSWPELPNAEIINSLLLDEQVRPKVWSAADSQARAYVSDVGRIGARYAVKRHVAGRTTSPAWGAANTLIAWPESAALLDLTPDALRTIIDVADGDVKHQAVLLLPAVIARSMP